MGDMGKKTIGNDLDNAWVFYYYKRLNLMIYTYKNQHYYLNLLIL